MRENCQTCDLFLKQDGEAYICSYECTYCGTCAQVKHKYT
ncbi:MAG: DUF1272 domain-containing protein, partial [Sphingomonadales bacterium]